MKYLSLFSGIEAASVAWIPLGWEPLAFAEIDKFCCRLLMKQFSGVPNLGDVTKADFSQFRGLTDVLVGGSPCQSFSIAGQRHGLHDGRGNLTLRFCEVVDEVEPKVTLWENVPGVLSDKTNAFGCLLGALVGAGAPIVPERKWKRAGVVAGPRRVACWRVLDAQFFGLAQRRKRVFVVASPHASGIDPAAILLESTRLRWDPPPRPEAGQDIADPIGGGTPGRGWSDDFDRAGAFIPVQAFGGNNTSGPIDVAPAQLAHGAHGRQDFGTEMFIVCARSGGMGVQTATVVRRLTPTEVERLQGFPDGWTAISGAKDGPRYMALGNSMAVPVIMWIGRRIRNALEWAPRRGNDQ